jgi:hypothetical protein
MSFIDHIRSNKEIWKEKDYGGFDPDLHNSGVATATVRQSSLGRREVLRVYVDVLSIKKTLTELQAVMAMQEMIWATPEVFLAHTAIVEGQRIYPNETKTPKRAVAKGNDLINLAHISGTARAMYIHNGVDVETGR